MKIILIFGIWMFNEFVTMVTK